MILYEVTNRVTKEKAIVGADSFQEACEQLGWMVGSCFCGAVRGEDDKDYEVECCICHNKTIAKFADPDSPYRGMTAMKTKDGEYICFRCEENGR